MLAADIYDPTINRSFAELGKRYRLIAAPARVAAPKDKAKAERFIQVARELYKRLDALYPDATLEGSATGGPAPGAWRNTGLASTAPPASSRTRSSKKSSVPASGPFPPSRMRPPAGRWRRGTRTRSSRGTGSTTACRRPTSAIRVNGRITDGFVTIYFPNRPIRHYPRRQKSGGYT